MAGILLRSIDKYPLSDKIRRIVAKEGENYVLFIQGMPQRGKSRTGLHICHSVDPSFSVEDRVAVIDPNRFNEILNQKHHRGHAIMFDDCGVGMDSRKWYDYMQIALTHILQTMGHEGLLLVLTTPHISFVDVKARRLIYGMIKAIKYYPQKGYTTATFKTIEPKEHEDDYYRFNARLLCGKKIKTIKSWRFPDPPKEMLDEYYRISAPEKTGLKANYDKALQALKEENKTKENTNFDIKGEILKDPSLYIKEWNNRKFVDADQIMGRHNIGKTRAYAIKKMVETELGLG